MMILRRFSCRDWLRLSVLLFATLLCPLRSLVAAQVTSSSILGYVFDPSGAAIPNAEVTVSDARHALTRHTTTDAAGAFIVLGLPPATYSVTASAPSFAEVTQQGLVLEVNTELRADFRLALANVKKTIEVQATANPLQTESADLGAVIDQNEIENLPLNRRDFLFLALLAPGVLPPVQGSELSTRGAFSMHAGGGREEFNNFLLDGADNNDPYVDRYGVEPPVDSIQEFKVATNDYSAEYGRSAAGQVNVITRQGTDNYHGSVYDYFRNGDLDARNFFDSSGALPLHRNQFGFSGGGPILRDKTFFFASTDFYRNREGLSDITEVPTLAERAGNGIIATGQIPALVTDVLNLYPLPNYNGANGNYFGSPVGTENTEQGNYRVDHHLSGSDLLTFRYSFADVDLFEPYLEGSSVTVPGYGDYLKDHIQNFTGQYQKVLNSRATNSVRIAYGRFSRDLLPQNYNVDVGSLWGVNWLNVPTEAQGFPNISVGGFSSVGDSATLPILRHTNTYQIGDSLTLDRGAHVFKIGVDIRKLQLNGILDLYNRGSISFTGAITGSGINDLLEDLPTYTLQSQANNPIHMRTQSYDGYVEDDWRILHNVTLNLGLRYEYNTPTVDPTNGMSDLDLQTGQVVPVGTNGITRSGIYPDYNNFAPRLGVAWSPAQNWVVRAGYGIFYDSGMFVVPSSLYFNPPEFNLALYFQNAVTPVSLADPFPSGLGYIPPPTLAVLNPDMVTPYIQQWNLTVERSFGAGGTLTVAYAASKGTDLIRSYDLNQPALDPTAIPGDLEQSRRPYPAYANIFDVESGANSIFNSLQASYLKRMSSHFSLRLAYTYSHSIDDQSAFLGIGVDPNFPQNSHDLAAERADSSFDMRHRFVAAYVIDLPQGNLWTRNTEIRGITTIQSGQPFTPELNFDNSNTGDAGTANDAGTDRPNVVGSWTTGSCPNPSGGAPFPVGTVNCWFNTSAFVVGPPNTYGDAGRNIIRGPGFASFDLSALRNFNLTEHLRMSFEAQAFNLFNRPNFNQPDNVLEDATFGQIGSAKDPRQIQLALRFSF
jgi:outer membrane receptor protein involved in Fe transport